MSDFGETNSWSCRLGENRRSIAQSLVALLPIRSIAAVKPLSSRPSPVALPVGPKKLAEKKAEVEAAGIILPEGMDDELFCEVFGIGSTKSKAGKEMEAIRAANFLTNNDPNGGDLINFNKVALKAGQKEAGARGRREGGRRRRG